MESKEFEDKELAVNNVNLIIEKGIQRFQKYQNTSKGAFMLNDSSEKEWTKLLRINFKFKEDNLKKPIIEGINSVETQGTVQIYNSNLLRFHPIL